jgi:hypothetical protein
VTVVFLKKYASSGISPFAIKEATRVREDEVLMVVISTPESLPTSSSSINGLVGGGLLANSSAMECGAGAGAVQRVAGKDGKARVRNDETQHAQWCSALYAQQATV